MDKKQMIKWALIAGAAYLVYRWIQQNGGIEKLLGMGTSTGTGDTPAVGAAANNQIAPPPPAAAVTPPVTPPAAAASAPQIAVGSEAGIMAAALDKGSIALAGNTLLSAWEWNYYRQAAAVNKYGSAPDTAKYQPTLDDVLDPSVKISAAQYWAALDQKGISGLGLSGWGGGVGYGGWQ